MPDDRPDEMKSYELLQCTDLVHLTLKYTMFCLAQFPAEITGDLHRFRFTQKNRHFHPFAISFLHGEFMPSRNPVLAGAVIVEGTGLVISRSGSVKSHDALSPPGDVLIISRFRFAGAGRDNTYPVP